MERALPEPPEARRRRREQQDQQDRAEPSARRLAHGRRRRSRRRGGFRNGWRAHRESFSTAIVSLSVLSTSRRWLFRSIARPVGRANGLPASSAVQRFKILPPLAI